MSFSIELKLQPSVWFSGIVAELGGLYSGWSDGSGQWWNQVPEVLQDNASWPELGHDIFETPIGQRARYEVNRLYQSMLTGDYESVRGYVKPLRYAMVIGYPRTGGSYLTKELLRSAGLDYTKVSTALAHDGFPIVHDNWYGHHTSGVRRFHLQDSVFQVAEYLVASKHYYKSKAKKHPDGFWLVPKKFHTAVNWAGSLKTILGPGQSDYLVTARSPLPVAISVYEKSGGLPDSGLFPSPRSYIETCISKDLATLGYTLDQIADMNYFDAVQKSWSLFYSRLATSGLFLDRRDDVRLIPYGKESLERAAQDYYDLYGRSEKVDPLFVHDKSSRHPEWSERARMAVEDMTRLWSSLGLEFPDLTSC